MASLILQQLINAATIGAIYALIALGYTMVYGVLRLINFVHSELFMLGAYLCYGLLAVGIGGIGPAPALGITIAFFAVFALVGSIGVTIERVAYKPLRAATRLAPMLSALGLSLFFQSAVQLIAGPQPIRFPSIFPAARLTIGGAVVTTTQLFIVALAVALMLLLAAFVSRTRLGVLVRAVSESPRTSALLGIDVDRAISLIFFIGPGLGGLGGILYGSYYGIMYPTMGTIVGLKAFTAAILGGIGSIPGAMLGGFLLGILEVAGTALLPVISHGLLGTDYRDIFAFVVLVGVLIFRPTGLLGEHISEETMVYKRDY
jgi:branched-chain amino acid transport system permease protein